MALSLNKITWKYFIYFMPLIMIDYFLIMIGININRFLLFPAFVLFSLLASNVAIKFTKTKFIGALNVFFLYSLLTCISYLFNDAPLVCFIQGVKFFLFPAVFAYIGYVDVIDDKFNKWYSYACLFCFIIGLYLYFAMPSFYTDYLIASREATWNFPPQHFTEEGVMNSARFSSFFSSSYAIQYFGVPALIISLVYSNNNGAPVNKYISYLMVLLSFVACILCQQRMTMAWAIFLPLFLGVYYSTKGKWGILKILLLMGVLLILFASTIMSFDRFDIINQLVIERFGKMNFSDAFADRKGQFSNFSRMTPLSMIVGLGLGSCSSIAGAFGLDSVFDSEFPKMFYELGIVGIILFFAVVAPTIVRGIKYFKYFHMELLIVVFYLVAGIGSDSLTFFIYDIMFWYSLGRIWNVKILSIRKQSNYI